MAATALCVLKELSETVFEVQAVPHFEGGRMSDNDFMYTVLSVNVKLIREHEHYNKTVEIPRGIPGVCGRISQSAPVPPIYSSATPRVV